MVISGKVEGNFLNKRELSVVGNGAMVWPTCIVKTSSFSWTKIVKRVLWIEPICPVYTSALVITNHYPAKTAEEY